jgi:hypothetical protein
VYPVEEEVYVVTGQGNEGTTRSNVREAGVSQPAASSMRGVAFELQRSNEGSMRVVESGPFLKTYKTVGFTHAKQQMWRATYRTHGR